MRIAMPQGAAQAVSRPVVLHISPDAERTLRFGHPWLYAQAISKQSHAAPAGTLAAVYDKRERLLAIGLYDPASPIRVRVLQRGKSAPIDAAWFRDRIAKAVALREPLIQSKTTTGYRLVHGENDGLPGLVLDRYGEVLVMKLYTAAWAPHLPAVLDALAGVVQVRDVVLRLSRAVQRTGASFGLTDGMALAGRAPERPVTFREAGLTFEADVLKGQKTGFFLDQRDNRAELARHTRGRRVLDVFAYTGGFSVAAARGGATEVTSIDASQPALEAVRRNITLNRKEPPVAKARHEVMAGDAFKLLEQLGARHARYEVVVVDPPSFAKTSREVERALAAYRQLTRLGLAVLSPGGMLMISCCSGQVGADEFYAAVHQAAARSGRVLRELARTGQPIDHPISFREGAYLKSLFAVAGMRKPPSGARVRRRASPALKGLTGKAEGRGASGGPGFWNQ
jgi:23S rRNA (cytosine1962-C5)-methyltransferase